MTLFPGSVHESAPTNTIILLSPHPGADSARAAHSLVSRADVSLRAFQSGCSRSPPSCRVAGRHTYVCACVRAMQTCVHTSVLTLEHGQLQAGRQVSRLRLPFRLPAHGPLVTVFRVGLRGDGSYSRPCAGERGSLLSTTSSSCERGERKWVGGGVWTHLPEWMGLLDMAPPRGWEGFWGAQLKASISFRVGAAGRRVQWAPGAPATQKDQGPRSPGPLLQEGAGNRGDGCRACLGADQPPWS